MLRINPDTNKAPLFKVTLTSDILHIHLNEGANFTLESVQAYFNEVRSVLGSRSCGVLVYGQNDVSFDADFKETMTSNPLEGIMAMAIVNPGNMATLQFAIYMLNVGKRNLVPLKIFNDQSTAENWLLKKINAPLTGPF